MNDGAPAPGAPAPGATTPGVTVPGGVLLLDKPAGLSSFQALRPVKRAFPKTKIGHAGTLDPAATGLLLIGVGGGTRLLEYLEGMPKTYSFVAHFGAVSDSYDMESPLVPAEGEAAAKARVLDREKVEKALEAFRGTISQTPPDYSAIKIQGERACDRVRAGETVTLAARAVTIHSLELKSFAPALTAPPATAASSNPEATLASASFEMNCSKGTYVRSLVHDLGRSLGCGAVTDKIRRLAIGPFRVEDARAPESLAAGPGALEPLLPLDAAVRHLPRAVLSEAGVAAFLQGRAVDGNAYVSPDPVPGTEYRALDAHGRLIAIATLSPQGLLCPKKVLARN